MLKPFRYEGVGYQSPAALEYGEPPQEEDQASGNRSQMTGLLDQFGEAGGMNMFGSAGGGEAALAQGGAGSMGPVAELAAAESTAGIGAEGGGGWMASMFGGGGAGGAGGSSSGMTAAMSNPWTALAAVIIGNEVYATQKEDSRDKNGLGYAADLGTGNVLNQDVSSRYLPAIGIDEGSSANKWLSGLSNPGGWLGGKLKDLF